MLAKYSNSYSEKGFWKTIKKYGLKLGMNGIYSALILYYVLQKPEIKSKDKMIILSTLGYLILPLDLIPDTIPLAGLGDDILALGWAIIAVSGNIDETVKEKARKRMSEWFNYSDAQLLEKLKII